jgi:F-type H+-transporting ATPase subunit b
MLIDWFTVTAQVLNFLVLVWLLKRFLYRPILDTMNAREQKIATQLRDAEAQKAEAAAERQGLRAARAEFEAQKDALLRHAQEEAEATRQQLNEAARQEVEGKRTNWYETLRDEQTRLRAEFSRRVQEEVFAIARQTLQDLAGGQLEEQIASTFATRLRALDGDEKKRIATLVRTSRCPLQIRSAFDLPAPTRVQIENAIKKDLACNVRVEFQQAADLVAGIELVTDGHRISWSVRGYLSSLAENVKSDAMNLGEPVRSGSRATDVVPLRTANDPNARE